MDSPWRSFKTKWTFLSFPQEIKSQNRQLTPLWVSCSWRYIQICLKCLIILGHQKPRIISLEGLTFGLLFTVFRKVEQISNLVNKDDGVWKIWRIVYQHCSLNVMMWPIPLSGNITGENPINGYSCLFQSQDISSHSLGQFPWREGN